MSPAALTSAPAARSNRAASESLRCTTTCRGVSPSDARLSTATRRAPSSAGNRTSDVSARTSSEGAYPRHSILHVQTDDEQDFTQSPPNGPVTKGVKKSNRDGSASARKIAITTGSIITVEPAKGANLIDLHASCRMRWKLGLWVVGDDRGVAIYGRPRAWSRPGSSEAMENESSIVFEAHPLAPVQCVMQLARMLSIDVALAAVAGVCWRSG